MLRSILVFLSLIVYLNATKIHEISSIVGVRDNQLIGYGLIVGLNGTGDGSSAFTQQSLSNMLKNMNVQINAGSIKSKNVAAVIVTTKLDSFARQGDKLDISISSIGDAKSLEGGTLLITPLKAVDGKIYALAQGSVSIGGKNGRNRGNLNHPTSGKIFDGATVERESNYDLFHQKRATISLNQSSFDNAIKIQNSINKKFHTKVAVALDPKTVKLKRPDTLSMIEFLAKVQLVDINYSVNEKIVINERTGTIVAGINIEVLPVLITHGGITIKINELSNNQDVDGDILVNDKNGKILEKKGSNTVANIAKALQKLGAKPRDIIAILEAIKKAGAIKAKLEVI